MKPYSEDLRLRIVQALRNGLSKNLRRLVLFGVSLSSVKRYTRIANRGASLQPRKGGGRAPKTNETIKKLLEEDLKERPAATVCHRRLFLQSVTGDSLSLSTIKRLLKRMGFSQKTDCGSGETRRVTENRLEGVDLGGGGGLEAARFR
jgi:transposase